MNVLRTDAIDASLERRISRARLSKYLAACDNSLPQAISLYERNTRLAEAFYTPLQSLEVCLRNTLHERMTEQYGSDWMTNGIAPLSEMSNRMVGEALDDLKKEVDWPSNDAMVAEMKFGFWVGLLGPGYDDTLWRKTLFKAFTVRKRAPVHGRLNALRRFRNRVAHHEPIFVRNLTGLHAEILETIGWMCPHTEAWATHHSRFGAVYCSD